MIVYFTGTGNSKYLAEIMSKQLKDEIVDAAELIRSGEHPQFTSVLPYVFVAPVYAWQIPRVFEEWIRKCKFFGNKKAYFVLNCGSSIGAADIYARKLSEEIGFEHMGMAEVVMPENYIAMFRAPDEERADEMITAAEKITLKLTVPISEEKAFAKVNTGVTGRLCSGIINKCFYRFYIGAKKFYTTDECISCGKCADNCMLNNIILKDGKPSWGTECTHCMACICKCPAEAIEYGRHTKGLRRYVCPK